MKKKIDFLNCLNLFPPLSQLIGIIIHYNTMKIFLSRLECRIQIVMQNYRNNNDFISSNVFSLIFFLQTEIKNNNDNCVRRTLTLKVMLSVLLITQTGSRTHQHNYDFNGVWVNRTDAAWRHLPLAWQWKNLIESGLSIYSVQWLFFYLE